MTVAPTFYGLDFFVPIRALRKDFSLITVEIARKTFFGDLHRKQ